ncbi:MAG: hypothetical protein A3C64_01455 [Candidatus Yanofskybacteria bacterium RIFCSPHIGHO2_02_FULL_41_12]|nr:MAG: hypothetical protein A3C64_01455 [Candidatus Yanofskybacteria bacterium RIFCSPHIGHO2_02_FULL_41_12]OGN20528.1 MAG: hypothetical protein A3B00_01310 [Candidatus Yanofskybacteria bacterium RIFCSPLOWO2_01_FULL_41_33]
MPKLAAPKPSGKNTAKRPKKKTNVISITARFSLKIEPRYDGRRTVMQQGANSAAIPATNAVTSDAIINISMIVGTFALSPRGMKFLMPFAAQARKGLSNFFVKTSASRSP